MKTLFFIIITYFSFIQTTKVLPQKKIPIAIKNCTFQQWVGGQEQTVSGTNFTIEFVNKLPKYIELKKVYFNNQIAFFDKSKTEKYIANFYQKPKNYDINLNQNPNKEYGNEVPETVKFPYKLKPNQAVLEFLIHAKIKRYKIENCKEIELIAYPQMRPKNEE